MIDKHKVNSEVEEKLFLTFFIAGWSMYLTAWTVNFSSSCFNYYGSLDCYRLLIFLYLYYKVHRVKSVEMKWTPLFSNLLLVKLFNNKVRIFLPPYVGLVCYITFSVWMDGYLYIHLSKSICAEVRVFNDSLFNKAMQQTGYPKMLCKADFPASILRGINGFVNIWMISPSSNG